jgi:hypothetical protein
VGLAPVDVTVARDARRETADRRPARAHRLAGTIRADLNYYNRPVALAENRSRRRTRRAVAELKPSVPLLEFGSSTAPSLPRAMPVPPQPRPSDQTTQTGIPAQDLDSGSSSYYCQR